jgi:RNA polymerase sigma-70 factor (ECF subfamily)
VLFQPDCGGGQGERVEDSREAIIDWVALHILPHEAYVRAWLMRAMRRPSDVDDVIQEAYCQIAELETVDHIRNGRAYFLTAARSMLLQRLRRERVVRIEAMTDIDAMRIRDEGPSPERAAGARRELERVLGLIAMLPPVCRQVIELRRIHGFTQKETALRLGVTESVVENNSIRGLKAILKALEDDDGDKAAQDVVTPFSRPSAHVRH